MSDFHFRKAFECNLECIAQSSLRWFSRFILDLYNSSHWKKEFHKVFPHSAPPSWCLFPVNNWKNNLRSYCIVSFQIKTFATRDWSDMWYLITQTIFRSFWTKEHLAIWRMHWNIQYLSKSPMANFKQPISNIQNHWSSNRRRHNSRYLLTKCGKNLPRCVEATIVALL